MARNYTLEEIELRERLRAGGCIIKSTECQGPIDIDEVKTWGSGGKVTEDNCMALCRFHHIKKGTGKFKMLRDYDEYVEWAIKHEALNYLLNGLGKASITQDDWIKIDERLERVNKWTR